MAGARLCPARSRAALAEDRTFPAQPPRRSALHGAAEEDEPSARLTLTPPEPRNRSSAAASPLAVIPSNVCGARPSQQLGTGVLGTCHLPSCLRRAKRAGRQDSIGFHAAHRGVASAFD